MLSPSTEQHDRLGKLAAYTQIVSLEEYLLVDQQDMLVDLYHRSGEQWQLTQLKKGDLTVLNSINLELPVADIYRGVIGGLVMETTGGNGQMSIGRLVDQSVFIADAS